MPALRSAVAVAVFLVAAPGCDTLRARHRAGQAAELYKAGEWQHAMHKYEQAVRLDPSIDVLHLDLAFSYLQLYNASPRSSDGAAYGGLAVRAFEEYLRRRPDDRSARDYLVQTFVDTKRYDDAVAYFKPEIERTPPTVEAIITLGQIAAKTNRIDQAIAWYEERVKLDRNDPDGPYNLGILIWDHLHNHAEVAGPRRLALAERGVAALRSAILARPHAADGYAYLNLLYREKAAGEVDDAAKQVDLSEADLYLHIATEVKAGKTPPPLPPLPSLPSGRP